MLRLTALFFIASALLRSQAPTPSTAKASITVVSSITGAPMPGVEVWVLRERKIDPNAGMIRGNPYEGTPIRATTDNRGQAAFEISPGRYGVQVNGFDLEPRILDTIVVEESSVLRHQLKAIPHAVVQGIVTDDRGQPMRGASVEILKYQVANTTRPGLQSRATALTDAQGKYHIESRQPGDYYVRASAQRLRLYGTPVAPVYFPNTTDFQQAKRVAATAGSEANGIDFRLATGPSYHVIGEIEGEPKGQLRLWAYRFSLDSPELDDRIQALTYAPGRFDIMGLVPGHYYITAEGPLSDGSYQFASAQVTVENRDVTGVRLRLTSPKELRGVVRVEAGLTQPFEVRLESWGPPFNYTVGGFGRVDAASGAFTLPNVFGREYSLSVNGPRGGYVKSAHLGLRDVTGQIFNPGDGSETLTIEIAAGHGALTGTVAPTPNIPKGATAMLVPTGSMSRRVDLIRTTTLNAQGGFEFTGLAPGSYKLLAWEKYDSTSMNSRQFLGIFPGLAVEITDGKRQSEAVPLIPFSEVEKALNSF